jgi:two-component system chemotaxis response regulator CheB
MDSNKTVRDTIVVGASAGGVHALQRLLTVFPRDFPASIFVAQHMAPDGESSLLDRILGRSSAMTVQFATHGMSIQARNVYLAPPDHHLMLSDDHMTLVSGPRENRARPAVDPLFRSAAVLRRERVIGVVLTGFLDDGAAGLLAVKRCGGMALVQDPDDAEAPSMPRTAAEALGPALDGAYAIEQLGRKLVQLVGTPAQRAEAVPQELVLENSVLATPYANSSAAGSLGEAVPLVCPECSGPLHKIDDGVLRYRCYTGHAFTQRALLLDQGAHVERALWEGVRSLEERSNTLLALARDSRKNAKPRTFADFEKQATQLREHAQTLRTILLEQGKGDD